MNSIESFDKEDFITGFAHWSLFKSTNGNDAKPDRSTQSSLHLWMGHQHRLHKEGKMTRDHFTVLDEAGFPWRLSQAERWKRRFNELAAFQETNGHCKVPRAPGLGEWVSTQRREMAKRSKGKDSNMTPEREEMLNSIGFEWNLNDWDENYKQLRLYFESFQHSNVPQSYGPLGRWVRYQRERYWKSLNDEVFSESNAGITEEQIEKLEVLGFDFGDHMLG